MDNAGDKNSLDSHKCTELFSRSLELKCNWRETVQRAHSVGKQWRPEGRTGEALGVESCLVSRIQGQFQADTPHSAGAARALWSHTAPTPEMLARAPR